MTKKIKPAETQETEPLQNLFDYAVQGSIADQSIMAYTDVLKKTGQIEAFQFMASMIDVATAQTYKAIKQSKHYKGLPYKDANGHTKRIETLEEYCEVFLKKSARRVRDLVQNYDLLGAELYEQAEQMGLRTKDYQALKALPADDQAIVKQAIETKEREQVIELIEEMAVKHKNEKDRLTKQLADTTADLDAARKVSANISDTLHKTRIELEKTKKHIKDMTPIELGEAIREEAALSAFMVEADILGSFRKALDTLKEHQYKTGINHEAFTAGLFAQVSRALNQVKIDFSIKDEPDDNPIPYWMRPEAKEQAEAAIKALPPIGEE